MTARLWPALEDQPLDRSAIAQARGIDDGVTLLSPAAPIVLMHAHQPLTMNGARLLTHPNRLHQRVLVAVGLDQILLIEGS